MRVDLGTTENEQSAAIKASTDKLLKQLVQHHDYTVPFKFATRRDVVEIRAEEEAEPIEVCILPVAQPKLTVEAIKRVVCKHFGISHNDMVSDRRDHKVQRPRMLAIWLAKELTPHGLPTLGRFFHRDHTTVLHSVRKMQSLIATDSAIAHDARYLRQMLVA